MLSGLLDAVVDGFPGGAHDALRTFHEAGGVLLQVLQHCFQGAFHLGVLLAEQCHPVDHILRRVHDFCDILHLLLLHPGTSDEAEERNQRLFRGHEDVALERPGEDVGILHLRQLPGAVVGDEHNHVVEGLAADYVLLVLFAGEFLDVVADRLEIAQGRLFAPFIRIRGKVVGQGGERHFRVYEDVRLVGEVQDKVRAHHLACLFVAHQIPVLVPEPVFGLVVVSFPQALVLEHIFEYGLPEVALDFVLSLKRFGQVFRLVAYGFSLLAQVLDRLGKLGLDGGTLLGVGFFLRLEGFLHIFDILVQTARDGLHCLGRLLLQGFLAGLEYLLVFQRESGLRGLYGLGVVLLYLLQGLLVPGFLAG